MKFYVAGSSKLIGWAQLAMAILEQAGHTVTEDWTKWLDGRRPDRPFAGDIARQDLEGVARADAILFLFDPRHPISAGAWLEVGYAIRAGKPVFLVLAEGVSVRDLEDYIFLFLSEVVMSSTVHAAIRTAEYCERTGNLNFLGRGGNVAYRNYLATMPRNSTNPTI